MLSCTRTRGIPRSISAVKFQSLSSCLSGYLIKTFIIEHDNFHRIIKTTLVFEGGTGRKSKQDFLSLLGDMGGGKYPIYMTRYLEICEFLLFSLLLTKHFALFSGPLLHTQCTAVIDLDEKNTIQ